MNNDVNSSDKANGRRAKGFWLGFFIATVIVLIPAIYTNQKQNDFIELQKVVIEQYKMLTDDSASPTASTAVKPRHNTAIPIYDPASDVQLEASSISSQTFSDASTAIYLGAGSAFQVADNRIARVLGSDDCPEKSGSLLFGSSGLGGNGCVLLTGKLSVDVRLVFQDGSELTESWRVNTKHGRFGSGVQLVRPNGWIVREPGK